MRIAFWNTGKNRINKYITALVNDYSIDFLGLAEYEDDLGELEAILYSNGNAMNVVSAAGCERIKILSNAKYIKPGCQDKYSSIQIVNDELLLCCVHLSSNLFDGKDRRLLEVQHLVNELNECRNKYNLDNVVYFGDFNENPYEDACMCPNLLHAIPSSLEVQKKTRVLAGRTYEMFYNPMWNFFGDFKSPPGTYYHKEAGVKEPFWHILDQVVISNTLLDRFVNSELKIVTDTTIGCLLNNKNKPNPAISDHLPIVFEIRER